jgi:hypothetical protein
MDWGRLSCFVIGLIIFVIGVVAIFSGKISGPGPLGVGGLWDAAEEPFRFWSSVIFSITFGGWVMYKTAKSK